MNSNTAGLVHWHLEFAKVIGCELCSNANDPNLLRDCGENVPQPGYIGSGYASTGLLLVGQNPGLTIPRTATKDLCYFAALGALRAEPTELRYADLQAILIDLIPDWPVQQNYFPLKECALGLDDIAYCNLVRCRTKGKNGNTPPKGSVPATCVRTHFAPWLDLLKPSCVVFVGHWAREHGGREACAARGIPYEAVNRDRYITRERREANRKAVADFVQQRVHPVSGSTRGSPA